MWTSVDEWSQSIHLLGDCTIMPPTPSSKRQRSLDADLTPTQRVATGSDFSLGDSSERSSAASLLSNSCRPTKRSISPKKREFALRRAPQFPVDRKHLSCMEHPGPLIQALARVEHVPAIPILLKARIAADSNWTSPPRDSWFFQGPETDDAAEDAIHMYRRIRQIRDITISRQQELAYEVEWNESVHWPLLELALASDASPAGVVCRNITQSRVYPEFREPDPCIADTKSDYALCLKPAKGSRLAESLRAYQLLNCDENRVSHIQLSDEACTPPAIGIETKSGCGGDGSGSTQSSAQSASFVRAQYRHLARLPNVAGRELPRLLLVYIHGAHWSLDVAQRTDNETIIYGRLNIGSSDSIHGCYVICSALSILARWCEDEYKPWLEAALSLQSNNVGHRCAEL